MPVTEADVLRALSGVRYPGFTRDIVTFGIVKDHPFVDGNKRVALTVAAVFLEINGTTLEASEAETACSTWWHASR